MRAEAATLLVEALRLELPLLRLGLRYEGPQK
jgi:hypothetical protein